MNLHPGSIAARDPDREAIVIGAERWSYARLDHFSADAARVLHTHGIAGGDVVAILMGNRPEFLGLCWAMQRGGLYYLPVPTRSTPAEIAYLLNDSGAKALLVEPALAANAAAACEGLDFKLWSIGETEHAATLPQPTKDMAHPPAVEGGDMLYTSGTTGRPKGVRRPLTGEPLGSDARRVRRGEELFGFTGETRFLSPAPLYHAAPLRFAMNLLRTGACVVGMERFDAADALRLLEAERITHSQWVPTMFKRLLDLPLAEREAYNLSAHQTAIHAGAPCPPAVKRAMLEWWGPILHEYYSGTESVGFTHITAREWLERPGSVGRPYGCTVHILDKDGREMPPDKTGAVYFAGKGGFAYHGDPAKTQAAKAHDGLTTMGDVGFLDEDGFLFLTDRAHFTIISGGVNIYPSEVEAALLSLPQVRDCAVFGLPDPDLGEAVAAVVEAETADSPLDADLARKLAAMLDPLLARPKHPRLWRFGSVGRNETGKIAKAALREHCARPGQMLDLRQPQNTRTLEEERTP